MTQSQQPAVANPFVLLMDPESVFRAIEKSERLGKLNRHLCRPLDRPVPTTAGNAAAIAETASDDDEDSPDAAA